MNEWMNEWMDCTDYNNVNNNLKFTSKDIISMERELKRIRRQRDRAIDDADSLTHKLNTLRITNTDLNDKLKESFRQIQILERNI